MKGWNKMIKEIVKDEPIKKVSKRKNKKVEEGK